MQFARPLLALTILLAAGAAFAAQATTLTDATALMATPDFGSANVTITSDTDDTLTSLTSPCCATVELHTSSMKDGVMSMRKLDKLDLKAGVPVAIAGDHGMGDSMHLMLIDAHTAMKPGAQFPITLHFVKAGAQTATFTVVARKTK